MPCQDVTTGRSSPKLLEVLVDVLSPAYRASPGSSSRETRQHPLQRQKAIKNHATLDKTHARMRNRTADTRKPTTDPGRISIHRAPVRFENHVEAQVRTKR